MPFGPFGDFGECMSDPSLNRRYPNKDMRGKVCNVMEQRLGSKAGETLNSTELARLRKENPEAVGRFFDRLFHELDQALGIRSGELEYFSKIEVADAAKHWAKIWLIDDTTNLEKWGVSRDKIKAAVEAIKGLHLLGPPEAGHGPKYESSTLEEIQRFEKEHTVGTFVSGHLNGSAWGIAEIPDEDDWRNIESGKWLFVSPRVLYNSKTQKDGKETIDEFMFAHHAFVNLPSYGPKARVLDTCEADSINKCTFSAAMESESGLGVPKPYMQNSDNLSPMPEGTPCGHAETIKQLQGELDKSKADITTLNSEKATLEASKNAQDASIKALQSWKESVEKQVRSAEVAKIVELKKGLGIKVEQAELDKLGKMSDDGLVALKEGLEIANSHHVNEPETGVPKLAMLTGQDGNLDVSKITLGTLRTASDAALDQGAF